jgi:hypothetical protein
MTLSENHTEQKSSDPQMQAPKKAKIWDNLRRRMDRSAAENISMRRFCKRARDFMIGMLST